MTERASEQASETSVLCKSHKFVPTHVVTLTQVVIYLGQTDLGTPFQVSAWVRKFSLGSTRDYHFFGMWQVTSFELGFVIEI